MSGGDPAIGLDDIGFVGSELRRPECVPCMPGGEFYVAHRGGGVIRIDADGRQTPIGAIAEIDGKDWIPNGIALLPDGDFLVANMGDGGGVWRLGRDGRVAPWLMEVDGVPLAKANFILDDAAGRFWITVTTRSEHVPDAMTALGAPERADGFICLVDDSGARIVADGLTFTNEARLDRDGAWLYVAETFGRRISRFRVAADSALSGRETFASFGHGTFADGIAFDQDDHLRVASVVSNRLIRIAPDGAQRIVLEDGDPAHIERCEAALAARDFTRDMFYQPRGRVLRNIASIAFGGADLRTVYLGSLAGDSLAVFRSPFAGLPLPHWSR